jgi:multiple sugar transport system ATP-binding protein
MAVRQLDLEVRQGELLVLVGPSGSGKTTTLRLIAGLEVPDAGSLEVGGKLMTDVPPGRRDVAMVFQDHPLFPHLSVLQNLRLALELRREPRAEVERRIDEITELLALQDLLERAPDTLSGGERQRVALGTALVKRPRLLMLDEPLAQLDPALRIALRGQVRELQRKLRLTIILVTHDQAEAMAIADRIAVIERGGILQLGTPMEVYARPANTQVARFIGSPPMNLIPGQWLQDHGPAEFVSDDGVRWPVSAAASSVIPQRAGPLILGLRPEALRLVPGVAASGSRTSFTAVVERIEPLGAETWVAVRAGNMKLMIRTDSRSRPILDEEVVLGFGWENAHWFDALSGGRL